METQPQAATLEPIGLITSLSTAPAGSSAELAQRIARQRAEAATFRSHYEEQLAALQRALPQRLSELDQHVRRRAEGDYLFAADDLSRQRRRLKKKEARLEAEIDRMELRRTRTKLQRRRLAVYFRLQRRRLRKRERADTGDDRYRTVVAERNALAQRLSEALRQLEASVADDASAAEVEQLQSRLERTLNDVRDLKRRNAELEQQHPPQAKSAPVHGLDWESQKRRMLAALEADDTHDEAATQERLTIDGTIRITDTVVQEKDREILELQERLEQQASGAVLLPSVAAMAEIFDQDEGIRLERERLKQLEEQWQGKLRQAEIDLSMERAKHARQQAELEELRRLQHRLLEEPASANARPGEPKAPIRGRWLARLGLKEGDCD
jgi:hypothetical protein